MNLPHLQLRRLIGSKDLSLSPAWTKTQVFATARQRPLPWLALLLLAALVTYGQVAAQPAAVELVAGSYAGTVLVSEPALLGDLDLLLEITSVNGQLTGRVNSIKTQVFLGGPTFTGGVTTSGVVTPTMRIESQTFSSEISGRTVQRQFVLTGEVLAQGDQLRGTYTETIVGFKPHPLLVKGTFLLVRPSGVTEIVTVPPPRGSTPVPTPTRPGTGGAPTPTATATATRLPGSGNGPKLFLPLVQRGAAVNAAAVEAIITDSAPTVTPTETPTPTPTETLLPAVTETPTPTPLVLGASPVLTTATEMEQQIHLPLIMQ